MPHIESEIALKKPFTFHKNGSLSTQPPEALLEKGKGVALMLSQLGGEHTFHPPAEELAYAMGTNYAVVAETPEGDLAGYVKMTPWVTDESGGAKMAGAPEDFAAIYEGKYQPVAVEVGSLVVGKDHQGNNLGKALVNQMLEVAQETHPGLPQIAVVTNDNYASLHVFNKLGWGVVGQEQAKEILGIDVLDGWPHPSTIFIYNG